MVKILERLFSGGEDPDIAEAKRELEQAVHNHDQRKGTGHTFFTPFPGLTADQYRAAAKEWDKKDPQ